MAETGSEVTVETESRGDVMVVHLSGQITEIGSDQISNRLDELFEQGVSKLVFDFTGVSFMSSTGLGQIMRAYRTACGNGGFVKIVNPQPLIADVFRVTKLDKLLGIFPTVEEALGEGNEQAPLSPA